MIMGSGDPMEEERNTAILTQGLGLQNGMGHSRAGQKSYVHFDSSAENRLREINSLDQRIWEEAKKLHRLDVEALRLMKKHGGEILDTAMTRNPTCCGYVCPPSN
mmetsp:Transcript_9458/g.15198  ORF Transcript_9458/g.15198 Transcript_9458/m.15198 type:complete len:105 (+) Transcript_9458:108-422(+)